MGLIHEQMHNNLVTLSLKVKHLFLKGTVYLISLPAYTGIYFLWTAEDAEECSSMASILRDIQEYFDLGGWGGGRDLW